VQVPSTAPRPTIGVSGHVDVAEWIQAPVYETGECRFDPCRRRHLAVAQKDPEHRPPKAEIARSSRAGETPALAAQRARARLWQGRGRGCEPHQGPQNRYSLGVIRPDEEPVPKTGEAPSTAAPAGVERPAASRRGIAGIELASSGSRITFVASFNGEEASTPRSR
jgi:hypothetical protein